MIKYLFHLFNKLYRHFLGRGNPKQRLESVLRLKLDQLNTEERAILERLKADRQGITIPETEEACRGWQLGPNEVRALVTNELLSRDPDQLWVRFNEQFLKRMSHLAREAKQVQIHSTNEALIYCSANLERSIVLGEEYDIPYRLDDPETTACHESLCGLGLIAFEVSLRLGDARTTATESGLLTDLAAARSYMISANQLRLLFNELKIAYKDIPDREQYENYARLRVAKLIGG